MNKLIILLIMLLPASASAIEVTRTWVKVLDAGETAIITPEDGDVKLMWSSGQPSAGYKGMVLKKDDDDSVTFESSPADLWARTNTAEPVDLTVNRPTDVNAL